MDQRFELRTLLGECEDAKGTKNVHLNRNGKFFLEVDGGGEMENDVGCFRQEFCVFLVEAKLIVQDIAGGDADLGNTALPFLRTEFGFETIETSRREDIVVDALHWLLALLGSHQNSDGSNIGEFFEDFVQENFSEETRSTCDEEIFTRKGLVNVRNLLL